MRQLWLNRDTTLVFAYRTEENHKKISVWLAGVPAEI